MFGRKKSVHHKTYDHEHQEPVIRKSICTGEEVAGFLDRDSGRFTSVLLIRSGKDLEEFRAEWGIEGEIRTIY